MFHLAKHVIPPPRAQKPVSKLLLVRHNRLGDAVCLLPAYRR